jgi:predicted nucleic acid-binding protein
MARYVVDAPTLLHLLDADAPLDPAHQLVAPSSIRSEALDLLLGRVRRGERSEREALALHERLTAQKIRLLGDRVSRRTAWQLALTHDWSLRDTEHVAVTRLQADALVTVDPALVSVADRVVRVAGVELFCAGCITTCSLRMPRFDGQG